MSFLKKALLTAAVAAVGLAGLVVAPSPAQAASTGTLEFVGSFRAPSLGFPFIGVPNSGSAGFSSGICADAAVTTATLPDAARCSINAWGHYGASPLGLGNAYCGLARGYLSGGFTLSNGLYYTFDVTYDLVYGAFTATGSARGPGGESGAITINGVVSNATDGDLRPYCLDQDKTNFTIAATANFTTF